MAEYKIKDIEILTGIKAHTIRIWEKRYGMLIPERTDTQIRTYTDADLSFLLNVSLLNKNGVKISKIATMETSAIHALVTDIRLSPAIDNAEEKLILALLELDEQLFRNTLNDLIHQKGLENTFSEHLIPFLDRIGVMWLVNSISAAQEHFISNLIRQKVITEIDKLSLQYKLDNNYELLIGNEVIDINLYKYNSYVGHINPIKFKVSAGSIEDIESIENIATLCSGCLGIS
jgi:DNA-binding transcriptional MerR regulator